MPVRFRLESGLGVGFLTYVSYGTLVVVAFAAMASGRPAVGALVMAPFGLARGFSAAVSWRSIDQERSRALVDRLDAAADAPRRIVNGVVLVAIAIAAAVAEVGAGSWGSFAGPLAAVFVWAAVAGWAPSPRPRSSPIATLADPAPERTATWAVPVAESIVPVLIVAGLPRAAAVWSGVLLVLFSGALVRAGRRVGVRVPCGCLGGRGDIDVNVALARNGALLLLAVFVFGHASDSPSIAWPGSPSAADVLPLLLALGALIASALVVWRASVWLAGERVSTGLRRRQVLPVAVAMLAVAVVTAVAFAAGPSSRAQVQDPNDTRGLLDVRRVWFRTGSTRRAGRS